MQSRGGIHGTAPRARIRPGKHESLTMPTYSERSLASQGALRRGSDSHVATTRPCSWGRLLNSEGALDSVKKTNACFEGEPGSLRGRDSAGERCKGLVFVFGVQPTSVSTPKVGVRRSASRIRLRPYPCEIENRERAAATRIEVAHSYESTEIH